MSRARPFARRSPLLSLWAELRACAADALRGRVAEAALDEAARALAGRILVAHAAAERAGEERSRGAASERELARIWRRRLEGVAEWLPGGPLGDVAPASLDRAALARAGHLAAVAEAPEGWGRTLPALHAHSWEAAPAAGATATPAPLARALVEAALARRLAHPGASPGELTLLDPACGPGALLVAAFDALLARAVGAADRPSAAAAEAAADLVTRRLRGVDIDPGAIESARLALALRCLEVTPRGREPGRADPAAGLRRGNFLLSPAMLPPHVAPSERTRLAAWDPDGAHGWGPCDVVVGNPPYVFGEHLSPVEKAAYRSHYPALGALPQPDRFALFYERSVERFLAPGGVHAFLVPDALLARDGHAPLRRYLRSALRVELLAHLGQVFAGARGRAVGVSAAAVIARRRGPAASDPPVAVARWSGGALEAVRRVAARDLIPRDGEPWPVHAPAGWFGAQGLRARLERSGRTVGDLLLPGAAGLSRGEELGKRDLPAREAAPAGWIPIHVGADVHRHRCGSPSRAVAPGRLRKRADLYAGPKLLVVKTGAGLVAAPCRADHPALQSLYLLHLDPACGLDEDAAAGLLCSALLTAYAYCRWTSGKRLQPQLTIGAVRALPAPPGDAREGLRAVGEQVRALRGLFPAGGRAIARRERAIDEAVAEAFGLDLAEWTPLLEEALSPLPTSQRPRWVC